VKGTISIATVRIAKEKCLARGGLATEAQ